MKTGWPPGLLQDDCRPLFKWFANRIDARWTLRKVLSELNKPNSPRNNHDSQDRSL